MSKLPRFAIALVFLFAALPVLAADPVIFRGIDTWATPDNGGTFADLSADPIPAGFFCENSPAFNGRIHFKGAPLVTGDKALRRTDTIIERLDDAAFNARGVARTRIRVRSLQLVGIENLQTACGEFSVRATLAGEQPITTMRIVRQDENGGRFAAPLRLNTRIIFTPVDRQEESIEFLHEVRFPANPHHSWSYRQVTPAEKSAPWVWVDTDWDGILDSRLPGNSNFAAGWTRSGNKSSAGMELHAAADAHLVEY